MPASRERFKSSSTINTLLLILIFEQRLCGRRLRELRKQHDSPEAARERCRFSPNCAQDPGAEFLLQRAQDGQRSEKCSDPRGRFRDGCHRFTTRVFRGIHRLEDCREVWRWSESAPSDVASEWRTGAV